MAKQPKDPKPKRYTGKPRGHTIEHPSGAVLHISIVCGRRYFQCNRFPDLSRHDGAGDDEVNAVIDEFERRASGQPPKADENAKGAA